MQPLRRQANPFALMIDPQAVLAQIEHSERLERLQRRICRPLDKPVLGQAGSGSEADAHDQAIDAAADDDTAEAGDA